MASSPPHGATAIPLETFPQQQQYHSFGHTHRASRMSADAGPLASNGDLFQIMNWLAGWLDI
jgi:hypothetical protein